MVLICLLQLMRAGSAEGGGYGFVNMWNPDEVGCFVQDNFSFLFFV